MRQTLFAMGAALVLAWGVGISPAQAAPPAECTIDFEGLAAGETVTTLSVGSGISGCSIGSTVSVTSMNTLFNPAGIVLDSATPGGGDDDLRSPNNTCGGPGVGAGGEVGSPFENCVPLGNIGILAEDMVDIDPADGLVDDPDDADVPGQWIFDFTDIAPKGVTVRSVTIMDVEQAQNEDPAVVRLIRSAGPPAVFALVNTGDNGVAMFGPNGINVPHVIQMEVNVKGSAGLVSAVFNTREVPGGDCWATFGGFNAAFNLDPSGQKEFSFGGNVGPPPSGHLNIVAHVNGEHLRIPEAEVVGCERIPALCDNSGDFPGPPSGNKNAEAPNLLIFEGMGTLNNDFVDDVEVTGQLIDCGEPAGKKDNAQDRFQVVIVGGPHAGTFLDVELDGGNVQLHGPVGPAQ